MENAVKKSYISNVGNGRVTFIGNDSTAAAMASISQVYEREAEEYMELNDIAEKNLEENGVVIMGSTFAKEMPVGELVQSFELDYNVYNRSFTDLSIADAKELFAACAQTLEPAKIILQLGETDLERGFKSVPELIKEYTALVKDIKKRNRFSDVVIVSVCENANGIQPAEFNAQLEKMADELGCKYADITEAAKDNMPSVKAFSLLRRFMRNDISFCEAMTMVEY